MSVTHDTIGSVAPLQSGLIPTGTRVEVFRAIYDVFLVLGTLVGIVVIAYMLYNAYKYRAGADKAADADRPQLGELPRGSGGGRKLFLSFGMSAVIVISLIAWTYGTLLYVEQDATQGDTLAGEGEPIKVTVEGFQFGWRFVYTDVPGHEDGVVTNELWVPQGRQVQLNVTSTDVWHNFGVPELRVKSDAIPGQYTQQWFVAEETGNYTARCYELCGVGHSQMHAPVVVTDESSFDDWYDRRAAEQNATASDSGSGSEGSEDDHGSLREVPA